MAPPDPDWYRNQGSLLEELKRVHKSTGGPPEIPGYDDLRELQRGGQGVVYSAIQKSTRRRVGVKVLLDGAFASDASRRRFEREIDLVSSLRHPNIVQIYDCGVTPAPDQRLYFVMEFIEGVPLHEYADALRHHNSRTFKLDGADDDEDAGAGQQDEPEQPPAPPPMSRVSIQGTLRLFAIICDAVNYAHQRGVIHRDLKPSNIRIDADGQPHILDFGLAKIAADEAADVSRHPLTSVAGQFIGSLPWASPEQADGKPEKMDIRSDVYSLGVILFQLLTGRFPYDVSGGVRNILDNILNTEPLSPREIQRSIDDEVETIALKCLSKEPDRRYQSAGELARDIRHYLAGEPIQAKRDGAWYTMMKTLRRYRVTGSVAALLAIILATGILATKWQADSAQAERTRAQIQAARAEQRFNEVRRLAHQFMFDFYDRIEHLENSRAARELLVASALEYLDRVSRETVDDEELQLEVAAAYQRIGDIQGNPTMENLGQTAGALESYRKALNIRKALVAGDPSNSALQSLVEETQHNINVVINQQVNPPPREGAAGGDVKH